METITTEQLVAMRVATIIDKDDDRRRVCDLALAGDGAAVAECARIADAMKLEIAGMRASIEAAYSECGVARMSASEACDLARANGVVTWMYWQMEYNAVGVRAWAACALGQASERLDRAEARLDLTDHDRSLVLAWVADARAKMAQAQDMDERKVKLLSVPPGLGAA